MKFVVTGGAGFIGAHVAEALIAAGHAVLVIDNLSEGRRERVPSAAAFEALDIRDRAALGEVMAAFQPDGVSHQAAQASVPRSVADPAHDCDVNVLGTVSVIGAAAKAGAQVVAFASSGGALYGEVPDGQAADEDWPVGPESPYGLAKACAERYLELLGRQHRVRVHQLRYANVYGPGQTGSGEAGVVALFRDRLLAGEALRVNAMREAGDAGCIRDYVHVSDVVRANVAALTGTALPSVLNVGTGVGTSTRQLGEALAQALRMTPAFQPAPARAGDLKRAVLDVGAFKQVLGPTTPLAAGLATLA